MLKANAVIMVVATTFALSAQGATYRADVQKTVLMKDGSKLYIFKNGKMGMEDKLGRPATMKRGVVMETKEGQKIIMVGNEVMRVQQMNLEDLGPR